MDSSNGMKNNVSGPLEHLLSLEWENVAIETNDVYDRNRSNNVKQVKKVRFADELETIKFVASSESKDTISSSGKEEHEIYHLSLVSDADATETPFKTPTDFPLQNCIASSSSEFNQIESSVSTFACDEENDVKLLTSISESEVTSQSHNSAYPNNENVLSNNEKEVLGLDSLVKEIEKTSFENAVTTIQNEDEKENKNLSTFVTGKEHHTSSNINIISNGPKHFVVNRPMDELSSSMKRLLIKDTIEKQSSQINSLLKKYNFNNYCTAEFESAVFKSWCKVKTDRKITIKDKNDCLPKHQTKGQAVLVNAYIMWKKSKETQKKVKLKAKNEIISINVSSSNDISKQRENNEAFKAWKKKKDEALKKRNFQKTYMELEKNKNSIMSAGIQKEEANSAYIAWKYHKSQQMKKEKEMQKWMLMHEEENSFIQTKRNVEALKIYFEWLKQKNFSETSVKQIRKLRETKPPWYPPS